MQTDETLHTRALSECEQQSAAELAVKLGYFGPITAFAVTSSPRYLGILLESAARHNLLSEPLTMMATEDRRGAVLIFKSRDEEKAVALKRTLGRLVNVAVELLAAFQQQQQVEKR